MICITCCLCAFGNSRFFAVPKEKLAEIVLDRTWLKYGHGAMPNDEYWEGEIEIGHRFASHAEWELRANGNGSIKICNLDLKICDEHDEGAVYDKGMLRTVFADINEDGYRDLVVSGRVLYCLDEKLSIVEKVDKIEDVVFIYMFIPLTKQFRQTYRSASFSIDVGKTGASNKGNLR